MRLLKFLGERLDRARENLLPLSSSFLRERGEIILRRMLAVLSGAKAGQMCQASRNSLWSHEDLAAPLFWGAHAARVLALAAAPARTLSLRKIVSASRRNQHASRVASLDPSVNVCDQPVRLRSETPSNRSFS